MLKFENRITAYICPEDKSADNFDGWVRRFAFHAPDGFTVTNGTGGWAGENGFVTEQVKLFTVWQPSPETTKGVLNTLNELRVQEGQEAVSFEVRTPEGWAALVLASDDDFEEVFADMAG